MRIEKHNQLPLLKKNDRAERDGHSAEEEKKSNSCVKCEPIEFTCKNPNCKNAKNCPSQNIEKQN